MATGHLDKHSGTFLRRDHLATRNTALPPESQRHGVQSGDQLELVNYEQSEKGMRVGVTTTRQHNLFR